MILTCPQCSTRYHVDATAVGTEGRAVRCASCGHRWTVTPPADTPKIVDFTGPTETPIPRVRPIAAAEERDSGSISLVRWLMAVLVILMLASLVVGRDEIVEAFPASSVVYHKLGLPVTIQLGLQFEGVTSKRVDDVGASVLVVEGTIVNVTDQDRPVPPIRITLLDSGGRQLQEELIQAEAQELNAQGTTTFAGRVVNPAEQASNFSITFDVD